MAPLLIFSSVISLILAEELPTPEPLRQYGPYGRDPSHFGRLSNIRSGYSDGIAGNNILAVRRHLIKNHKTGANENHPNLDTKKLYSESSTNINNNRITRTNAHQSNINNENNYQSTNNFPLNNNFGYETNSYNSGSDVHSSLHNNKYGGDYPSNSYSYENHDEFVNMYGGGSNSGSGNRGRDDIFNSHSGFRDPLNDYGNSGIEEFGTNGEYGTVDATVAGFDPLQGMLATASSPQESENNPNALIQSTKRQGRLEDSVNRQGHGGGYKEEGRGIDLYSLLSLGLFAAFLGYVIFYYISNPTPPGRPFNLSPQEYATLIMAEVFNALERWTLNELKPSLESKDIS